MPPTKTQKTRNRRRLGSRSYKNYSEEMLLLAVDLVKTKKTTSYDAEKQFGIPRRTIEKRVKNLHSDKPGPRFRLSPEEETKFVKVLIAAGDFGCPLSQLDLKLTVYDYLKKNNKTYVFNDKVPGDWWVRNFLERHKNQLTLRSTQNITKARAEKTLEEFKEYFKNLEISLQNLPPKNIMNYDETNLSDDPGSVKCIFRRGVKYPERIINHSKGCISIMFAGTAEGELLPPYVVYKSENLWTEWCKDGPEGARYNRSKSGWFDSTVFLDWFTKIVIPWASQLEGPKLVIGDNLSSHLNPDVVELCEAHQIRFVFLPPRSTQLTQPLDVAFFGPLKKAWRTILLQYKVENPKQSSLNKSHFPLLLKKLMEAANIKKQNLLSGFKATGIYPFNPYEVYKKIPEYEDDIRYDIDQTLLDYLKENKHPNPIKRGKNTKLNVPFGKSVSSLDISGITINKNSNTNQKTTIKKKIVSKTTLQNKDSKRKPLKKQKRRNESSSDSESSRSVPSFASASSVYDPRIDEVSESENEMNENMLLDDIDCKEVLEDQNMTEENEDMVLLINVEQEVTSEINDFKERNENMLHDENYDEVVEGQDREKRNKGLISDIDDTKVIKNNEKKMDVEMINITDYEKTNEADADNLDRNENSQNRDTKVKILSDIKLMPENKAYFDLQKYGPFTLEAINSNHLVKSKSAHGKKQRSKIDKTNSVKSEDAGMIQTGPIKLTPSLTHNMTVSSEFAAGCSKEPEQNVSISYNVNDDVLVRYLFKKKIEYYVGKIILKQGNKYQVSFYKRYGRKDSTKFTKPKKKDLDLIPEELIVKEVQLVPVNKQETEFVFFDEDDLVYFDC